MRYLSLRGSRSACAPELHPIDFSVTTPLTDFKNTILIVEDYPANILVASAMLNAES